MKITIIRTLKILFTFVLLSLHYQAYADQRASLTVDAFGRRGMPPVHCGRGFAGVCTISLALFGGTKSLTVTNNSPNVANYVQIQNLSDFSGMLTQDASGCTAIIANGGQCQIILTTSATVLQPPIDAVVQGNNTNAVTVTVQQGFP